MQSIELIRQIDKHIAAISASSERSTIMWHSGRCGTAINRLSYSLNDAMGFKQAALVKEACDIERNRLVAALREALDRAFAVAAARRKGGVK
jgi:hypothetical protein